jgi:hypothetical protein
VTSFDRRRAYGLSFEHHLGGKRGSRLRIMFAEHLGFLDANYATRLTDIKNFNSDNEQNARRDRRAFDLVHYVAIAKGQSVRNR